MPEILKDYITVAQRIEHFYAKYPEGSLQCRIIELSDQRVVMEASAFRTPTDERPGIGYSSMPIPAKNAMLRDSEIETCETSAWGRAIAALGFAVKNGVASQNEIDAKKIDRVAALDPSPDGSLIGIAKLGSKQSSDGELRQTPHGYRLGFRLEPREGDRGGMLVEVTDDLASTLSSMRERWVNMPVTCWGTVEDREFKSGTRTVRFQALALTAIRTPTITLPVPDDGTDEDLDAIAAAIEEP